MYLYTSFNLKCFINLTNCKIQKKLVVVEGAPLVSAYTPLTSPPLHQRPQHPIAGYGYGGAHLQEVFEGQAGLFGVDCTPPPHPPFVSILDC